MNPALLRGPRRGRFAAACALVLLTPRLVAADSAAPVELARVEKQVDAALARPELADYRGWLKFLRYEADTAAARSGPASDAARAKAQRLAEWLARISADPHLLAQLTGVQEWAYESPADDSGQPFKIAIPTDYNPVRPAALSVYMHGYSGNHLEHSTGLASQPGVFQIAVLGRSRGGGYRSLSEADVLHVIDYVQAHWAIDPDRIHINGGSMGGGGTYRLGSRYPHRWASARPTCGYASYTPVGNLLTLPIYATHSADDYVVSALHERGPLARLRALGGQVIYDETNGYGHAVWDYAEGNARGAEWVARQVRPASNTLRHLDYTALDGGAMRGWWGEIVEWGPAPRAARFVLTVGAANMLHAELTNLTRLRLRLAESPLDRTQPLHVAINGAVPITLAAPLPDSVLLARTAHGWQFETAFAAPAFRLHTPGSAALLYQGEPLLIVYGTQGSDAECTAMHAAAVAASKSPNPGWLDDSGQAGPDGVPHSQNLYGHLNLKADREVTDADIARCHLVLIGSAAQNAIVARLADRLPVTVAQGSIRCSDGETFPTAGNAFGLVHYNPLAPQRLIFWVASDDAATYAPGALIPELMAGGTRIAGNPCGADFLVMRASAATLVASRSFDSRWSWSGDRTQSPLLPATLARHSDFSRMVGAAIAQAAGTELALAGSYGQADVAPIVPGTTRMADVLPLFYEQSIGVFTLSGAELNQLGEQLAATPAAGMTLCGATAPFAPARRYRVALPADLLWSFSAVAHLAPADYRVIETSLADALVRLSHLPAAR